MQPCNVIHLSTLFITPNCLTFTVPVTNTSQPYSFVPVNQMSIFRQSQRNTAQNSVQPCLNLRRDPVQTTDIVNGTGTSKNGTLFRSA